MTVTKLIEALLTGETRYSHSEIVQLVKAQFPEAKTSTKSVASTASVMRRFGIKVEKSIPANPTERINELLAKIDDLEGQVLRLTCELDDVEKYAGIEVAA